MSETVELLGKLAPDDAGRDAIHIAVAPLTAGHIVEPGEHVGFMDETRTTVGRMAPFIGVVDPFLTSPVMPHQRVFVFLYPQTITGLRHVWTHPAFPEHDHKPAAVKSSEQWLRDFISRSDAPQYDDLIALATSPDGCVQLGDDGYRYLRLDDEYLRVGGNDASGDIPSEMWDHLEVVTGRKMTRRATYFSCSC